MNYWLDLFTGNTWKEFRAAGANISGFRERMRKNASRVQPGDVFLCYLTHVMRWVGALQVIGPSNDQRQIWKDAEFPVRFEVKPLVILDPEHGLPMSELEGKVAFYQTKSDKGKFKGFVRMSPNMFYEPVDGALIVRMLEKAQESPVSRPVDPKKLAVVYRANVKKGKSTISTVVTIPETRDDAPSEEIFEPKTAASKHTEIQYHLLRLGSNMGYQLWVARNDRSKTWDGIIFSTISELITELPTQFNEATNKTIELIDVLWLKGNSIVAAFEIESTTSIYSGLLRMSDLLALQPNLEIKLYLVAPGERRERVQQEILRPTFSLREKPLNEICGFLSFDLLMQKLEGIRKLGLEKSLKPEFLDSFAEYFRKPTV